MDIDAKASYKRATTLDRLILQNSVSRIYSTSIPGMLIMMTRTLLELPMSHLEAVKLDPRDRVAIEALITEFFDRIDCGPVDRLGELFVPDGVVKALDIGVDVKGSQAISEFFAARTRGRGFVARHSWNSLRILEVGEQEVRTSSIVVTYLGARPDVPSRDFSVGNCEDVFRRTADREWLFLSRNQVKIVS